MSEIVLDYQNKSYGELMEIVERGRKEEIEGDRYVSHFEFEIKRNRRNFHIELDFVKGDQKILATIECSRWFLIAYFGIADSFFMNSNGQVEHTPEDRYSWWRQLSK